MSTTSHDAHLPTFIVIGAAKCGTTSLAGYLGQHPHVFVTDPKEPGFFDGRHEKPDDLAWYRGLFEAGAHLPVRGEASTSYTNASFPGVPARVHALVPDVRLIYVIREPIERIESHYLMRLREGRTEGDLATLLGRKSEYIATSCYGARLSEYLEHFPREQILVLRLEDMAADTTAFVQRALVFLGADPAVGPDSYSERLNERPEGPQQRPLRTPRLLQPLLKQAPGGLKSALKSRLQRTLPERELDMPPEVRSHITAVFAEDFVALREIVGPDLDLYGLA